MYDCDNILENPWLATPPEEEPPPPPRKPVYRKKLVFPPKFPLIPIDFYSSWVNHRKELHRMTHMEDDSPPPLFPELYLKPRKLDFFSLQNQLNMEINRNLLRKINIIQRTGGWVDCWMMCPENSSNKNKLLMEQRQRELLELHNQNLYLYRRLVTARSDMLLTKEMDEEWKETKKKLILNASLPFILFDHETIHRGMKDPEFDKPPGVHRDRVTMDISVVNGAKVGKLFIEVFNDIAPKCAALFMSLVKGTASGHAYAKTSIFRVVPGLYCRMGDVVKNNGFGLYTPPGHEEAPSPPPNEYRLKHSVPGVMSMVVNKEREMCGQFNIIFKPLPQLDNKHVVFARIISGPAEALERISLVGLALGSPTKNIIITSCGFFNRKGNFVEGKPSKTRFPPDRFTQNVEE